MNARKPWSAAAVATSLVLASLAGAAPCALGAPGRPAARCNQACLKAISENYLAAMLAHDPAKAPFARGARYTENGVQLPLPDGLWRTVTHIGRYRLFVADPAWGEVGFFIKAKENAAPILVATRLRVVDRRITQIESIVARLTSTLGGAAQGPRRVDQLGDHPRKAFLTVLPPRERRTRAQLIAIVGRYYTGIENNTGDHPPPFARDCKRIENGMQTTGRPLRPGEQPGALNLSCRRAFALGYYHEDTRIRDRRVLAVDPTRGLVYAAVGMDHDATVRSYRLRNGHIVKVTRTAPWTWMAHEIFEVNAQGRISQIEAVLLSVPYGMRPGWSTGVHLPSPAARRDGFQEYPTHEIDRARRRSAARGSRAVPEGPRLRHP